MKKVYIHRFECEHDGDVRSEIMELEEAGAHIVDIQEDEHGDCDYWTTIKFTVADENVAKFEEDLLPLECYTSYIQK